MSDTLKKYFTNLTKNSQIKKDISCSEKEISKTFIKTLLRHKISP